MQNNWYAVYTRPRCEKKVIDVLRRKKIEHFCPFNRKAKKIGEEKIVVEPLFKSFVFVRLAQEKLSKLKQLDGVINLVYWLDEPVVISDAEIEAMRDFSASYVDIKLEKILVQRRELFRIVQQPIQGSTDVFLFDEGKDVRLALPALGYVLSAKVKASTKNLLDVQVLQSTVSVTA